MDYKKAKPLLNEITRKKLKALLPHINWDRHQILVEQHKALHDLLNHVKNHSPFYQHHYQHIDLSKITIDTLTKLPLMNKSLLMDHWDQVCCHPTLTKATAEQHLEAFNQGKTDQVLWQDDIYITATGGSSGVRGLLVWDLDFFSVVGAAAFRYQHKDEIKKPINGPIKIAAITAPTLAHASTPLFSICQNTDAESTHIPSDLPIDELCKRLEALQPSHLIGYSTVIEEVAHHALAGKVNIKPQRVSTNSEPLTDTARKTIREAWGLEVNNMWGSVEAGMMGIEDDRHLGLILNEDLIIFETLNEALEPCDEPEQIKHLAITNLFNKTLPLIRYVVDDAIQLKESDETAYRIVEAILGRSDDWFQYGDLRIHPMVYRHVLGQVESIEGYQVQQTERGAHILIIQNKAIDEAKLHQDLVRSLEKSGLKNPEITMAFVKDIPRHQQTGKTKRFVPLSQ